MDHRRTITPAASALIAVANIWRAPSRTGFGAVQPLALAFVAGYSVELVFAALDRLIGALAAGDQRA